MLQCCYFIANSLFLGSRYESHCLSKHPAGDIAEHGLNKIPENDSLKPVPSAPTTESTDTSICKPQPEKAPIFKAPQIHDDQQQDPNLSLRKVKSLSSAYPKKSPFGKKASKFFDKFRSSSPTPKSPKAAATTPSEAKKNVALPSQGQLNQSSKATTKTSDSATAKAQPASTTKQDPSPAPSLSRTTSPTEDSTLSQDDKSGFLMNTLRRLKPTGSLIAHEISGDDDQHPHTDTPPASGTMTPDTHLRVLLNHSDHKPVCPIPEITHVHACRVNFSLDTFEVDPPQQVPSKKPKVGSVKVDDTGVVTRTCSKSLYPAGETNYQSATVVAKNAAHESGVQLALSVKADRAEKKLHMPKLSRTTSRTTTSLDTKDTEDESDDEDFSHAINPAGLAIDTPKIDSGCSDEPAPVKPKKCELTDIYTRCCHLREIMPIKATMRQLEGRSGTLQYLRLLNPRPTLIEVLAFSDFISIVPINTLVLNRIDITEEMFKHLITSLTRSSTLNKLSLKNVNLTPNNWKVLCAFLVLNKSLTKLDISVADPDEYGKDNHNYYKIDLYDRALLDWSLLTKTIIARGGIEELILNRCLVPHAQFDELIRKACCIATKRLAVASSDLQREDLISLSHWTLQQDFVREGIDLGGNDLSHSTELIRTLFARSSVMCISVNSCNLEDGPGMENIMVDTSENSQMRFLDLSFNPKLFPYSVNMLVKYLPKFKHLKRLHLDHNNLTSLDLISLAEGFAKCPELCHISLIGNHEINPAAAEALATAVKLSDTITCMDLDPIPTNISRRLSHYCMQNMENMVNHEPDDDEFNLEDEVELLDNGNELVKAVRYVVDTNEQEDPNVAVGDCCMLVSDGLARRAKAVREKVQMRLENMIKKSTIQEIHNGLRENLIKWYYLDAMLEQVVHRYEAIQQKFTAASPSQSPETSTPVGYRNPQKHLDTAESMLQLAQQSANANERIHIPDIRKVSRTSLLDDEVETEPVPPNPESGYYELSPEGDVSMLRSKSSSSSAFSEMRKQEREEGDFHKISVFMKQNKPALIQEASEATGEQLRAFFHKQASPLATSTINARKQDVKSTEEQSASETPTKTTKNSVKAEEDGKEENRVDSLISKINNMSDEEVQAYFQAKYGMLDEVIRAQKHKKLSSHAEDQDDEEDEEEEEGSDVLPVSSESSVASTLDGSEALSETTK